MSRSRVRSVSLGVALFVGIVALAHAQLPQIDMSTSPYIHNMFEAQACPANGVQKAACRYSGNWVIHAQQWGAFAVNTANATWSVNGGMVSPITNQTGGTFQPASLTKCNGDFHQSSQFIAGSVNTPKWVVSSIPSLGTTGSCTPVSNPFKVQVYSLDNSSGLRYKGQVFVNSQGSNNVVIGDTAYVDLGTGQWTPVDLNSCSPSGCNVQANVSVLPPNTPQTTIGGFTYTFTKTGNTTYSAIRGGAPVDSPPVASASMTNLSAAARLGTEKLKNYLGDKWQIADTSTASPAEDSIQWDVRLPGGVAANFAADGAFSGALPNPTLSTLTGYWPCDPASQGNLATGAGCYASIGSPTAAANYNLGLVTHNTCATCGNSNTYVSPAQNVLVPQLSLVGWDGTNLRVLAGNPNNGDASASQGNIAEATFAWSFTPTATATGPVVTVPANATAFTLTATYKGGYTATMSGAVLQVDLVPNFSLSPTTALINSPVTLTNTMVKGAQTTLSGVDWAVTSSATPPPTYPNPQLAAGFNTVNGTGTVPAPSTAGSFYVHLRYNFSGPGGPNQQLTASKPLTTTTFVVSPVLMVYQDSARTNPAAFFNGFQLKTNTVYYLFDDETLPGGVIHPGSAFYKSTNNSTSVSGDTQIGTAAGAGPVQWTPTNCLSSCYIKVIVSGVVKVQPYSATSGGGNPTPTPTPTGGGGGTPQVVLACGTPDGLTVQCTATSANFTSGPSYSWNWGDGTGGPNPTPTPTQPPGGGGQCPPGVPPPPGGCLMAPPGGSTKATMGTDVQSHTYTSPGQYTVSVTATGGGSTKADSKIVQVGPPKPKTTYTLTGGATQNPLDGSWQVEAGRTLTFTATEADPNTTFSWDFGDGANATGRSVTHAYTSPGSRLVILTATALPASTLTSGSAVGQIRITLLAPSFQALMIPGAGSIISEDGDWATDLSVTNPGTTSTTITLYFAAFGDNIPSDLSTLPFDSLKSVKLDAGQSWSGVDVVGDAKILDRRGAGKGILFIKFDGGNQVPIATARVYFTADGSSYGTALPSFETGPYGQTASAQAVQATSGQTLVGLRNDSLYRFNVALFNASSEGGNFHLDIFSEDGERAGAPDGYDFVVPAYTQAGVPDTALLTPDPSKRYVIRVTATSGILQAYASVLDRRNNDLVQVADDTPRVDVAPDTQVNYYISGVGRIEIPDTNTHWRTDLRFFNPSTLSRDLTLEYRYTPTGSTEENVVVRVLHVGAGQGVSKDDIVGDYLDDATAEDLKTGTVLGLLKISYAAPTDVATAPLIIGGRIYADLATGTAGMQLATYTSDESVSVGGGALVMPGAQTNLRFRTNVGIFTQGSLPTTVRITAVKQDGSTASTADFKLNNAGSSGAYAQIPITEQAFPGIDGNAMTIKVETLEGSPVGAYIVTVDQISADTVFIQGKRVH